MPYSYIGSFLGMFFLGGLIQLMKPSDPLRSELFIFVLGIFLASTKTAGAVAIYYFTLPYLVIYVAYLNTPMTRWLDNIGDIFYGTYVYAFPVQQSILHFGGFDLQPWELMTASVPITWMAAYFSWHFVERPALSLKNYAAIWLNKAITIRK